MSRYVAASLVVGLGIALLSGCQKPTETLQPFHPPEKDYGKPLPPGALALRKIGPEDYPDFGQGFNNRAGLRDAVLHSIEYMSKPSSRKYFPYGDISHERAVASLQRFLELIDSAPSGAALNQAIRQEFDAVPLPVVQPAARPDEGRRGQLRRPADAGRLGRARVSDAPRHRAGAAV